MDRLQLLLDIVQPALHDLALTPRDNNRDLAEAQRAEAQLLMGTQAQESPEFDRIQIGGGPALGLWQMEPATHDDIWVNFLSYRPTVARRVLGFIHPDVSKPVPPASLLVRFDSYACRMARIQYYRAPEPLPAADDIEGMEELYLKRYNAGGKARRGEFVDAYNRLVAPLFVEPV